MKRPRELEELSGFCYLLSRLFCSPPDREVREDVKTLGWLAHDKGCEELGIEFTQLFSVPHPQRIHSHQSIYGDVLTIEASSPDVTGCGISFPGGKFRGYLGGESNSLVSRLYRTACFIPPDRAPAMADHISTELSFMGYLYLMEARFRKSDSEGKAKVFLKLREIFWTQFLGCWLKAFAEKVAVNQLSAFYRKVGHELLCFIERISSVRCVHITKT